MLKLWFSSWNYSLIFKIMRFKKRTHLQFENKFFHIFNLTFFQMHYSRSFIYHSYDADKKMVERNNRRLFLRLFCLFETPNIINPLHQLLGRNTGNCIHTVCSTQKFKFLSMKTKHFPADFNLIEFENEMQKTKA